ncbi:MAG: pyridoxamine 5'-phosphate oxidase family protein [Desulfobacterales bacterium]|nr:pyridoxamine 5'-phosphate oxidase family protein [Desulfobacterales bacterium]
MFRVLKREEKGLRREEAEALLAAGEYGVLSTIGEDGFPYGVPVNYVYEKGQIFFHCAVSGHKLDNIKACEKVSFCVVAESRVVPEKFTTHFKSVVAFGAARLAEGEEKERGLFALVEKYAPGHQADGAAYIRSALKKTGVVVMEVAHLSGKKAPADKRRI